MAAVFSERSDFKLTDVSRVRDGEMQMSTLPEKSGVAQLAVSLKDVAFLYEAVSERRLAVMGDVYDATYPLNKGVVIPRPLATGLFFGEVVSAVPVGTGWWVDGYGVSTAGLFRFSGIDTDKIDGLIWRRYDESRPSDERWKPLSGEFWLMAMDGVAKIPGFENVWTSDALLPRPREIARTRPLPYAGDLIRDIYYSVLNASGKVCRSADNPNISGEGYRIDGTYTRIIRSRTEPGSPWQTRSYTEQRTFLSPYFESFLKQTVDSSGGQKEEEEIIEPGSASGMFTLTVKAHVPDRVSSAIVCLIGHSTSGTSVESAEESDKRDYWKVRPIRLGVPDTVDVEASTATWHIPADRLLDLLKEMDRTRPELGDISDIPIPAEGETSRTAVIDNNVLIDRDSKPWVMVEYDFRTSLRGHTSEEWDGYTPDHDRVLP